MTKIINLREILKESFKDEEALYAHTIKYRDLAEKAMKEAVRQALELAAYNVKLVDDAGYTLTFGNKNFMIHNSVIDKETILNTINQIKDSE